MEHDVLRAWKITVWFTGFIAFGVEAQAPTGGSADDVQKRFALNQTQVELSYAREAWMVLMRVAKSGERFSGFAPDDRKVMESIVALDRLAIEWEAAEPSIESGCALPEHDLRERGRYWNEAEANAATAFDREVGSLLDRLSINASRRIKTDVLDDSRFRRSYAYDWEGIAIDQPRAAQSLFRSRCHNYRIRVDTERQLQELDQEPTAKGTLQLTVSSEPGESVLSIQSDVKP